jgi:Cu/Ag efflux protein CusF
MKKRFYVWHRWLGIFACLAVLMWSLTGLLHPIMSWTQPQPATQFVTSAPLPPDAFRVPLQEVLARNNVAEFKSLNIVSFEGRAYYQVEPAGVETPLYFDITDGSALKDGDQRYAVYLARAFSGDREAEMTGMERLTGFDGEYQSVNRLLPVYRVGFARPDGMRAYVETNSSRLGTLVNDRKAWFQWAFTSFHNWGLFGLSEPYRSFGIMFFMLLTFAAAASGICVYLLFWKRFRNRTETNGRGRLRKYHRSIGIIVALMTLMSSSSGAFHAFTKRKPDDRHLCAATDTFRATDLSLALAEVLRRESQYGPVTNVSLVRLERGAYYRVLHADRSASYINATTGARAVGGDERYARRLANTFSGLDAARVVSAETLTTFTPEYGFVNKRLPVVRVQYDAPGNPRYFVETASGKLAARVDDGAMIEGYSFAYLHKWGFLNFIGNFPRDLLMMTFALGNAVVAALGLWMFILWRGSTRPNGRQRKGGAREDVPAAEDSAAPESAEGERAEALPLRRLTLILLTCLFFTGGTVACGTKAGPDARRAAAQERRYPFRGQVVALNKEAGRVTFDHEEIAGYMEAMNGMPFPVREPRWIDELATGDEVLATVVVTNDNRSWLEEIDVAWRDDVAYPRPSPGAAVEPPHQH